MPKKAKELGPLQVKRLAGQDGFHAVGGVAGLHLQVRGTAASWVLRATVGGARRDIGLGGFPDVTLAIARDKARTVRAKIADGIDPLEERRAARATLSGRITFDEAARRMIEARGDEWRNPKHRAQWQSTLKTYASPKIGRMPVDAIEREHVFAVLDPIWREKTETATRVRGRIEAVLDWATVAGKRTGDNPAAWKGRLEHMLPKPAKVTRVKHHEALPIDGMHDFVDALRQRQGMGARALHFLILTAARSGEVRGATWAEVDLQAKVWTVPADRMKAAKEHRVPLSREAVALLRGLDHFAGTDLIFPSPRGQQLSDMALLKVMRDMGQTAVPHGFRSTFRDWAAERAAYPDYVVEMALAHTIKNKVEAAYRRGDLFDKRRQLMGDWAQFIDTPPGTGSVTPIRRRKAG